MATHKPVSSRLWSRSQAKLREKLPAGRVAYSIAFPLVGLRTASHACVDVLKLIEPLDVYPEILVDSKRKATSRATQGFPVADPT